jgi:hypothetical protein
MKFCKSYPFFYDPGHGWMKVPNKELIALGIVEKISTYSYMRGEYSYLEEDKDATIFITERRKIESEFPLKFVDHSSNKRSKIRSYSCYKKQLLA